MVIFLRSKGLPQISIEVAEKFLSPLELQIYKLLLQFEEEKSENGEDNDGRLERVPK